MPEITKVLEAFGFDPNTILVILGLTLPFVALSIICIIHAASREFASDNDKMVWVLIAGIPFFGFLVYLAVGLRKSRKVG